MPPPAAPAGVGRMGLAGGAGGTAGVTAPGDEVPGCGVIDATAPGFLAVVAVGLRAGALRAAGFRAAVLVALRAEVFFTVVLPAVARFAAVLCSGAFFLALIFLAVVLRALVFLRAGPPRASTFGRLPARCRFLPTRSRSHGFCSDLLCCGDAANGP